MPKFKIGDKVTLNCSVDKFFNNVKFGEEILKENFSKVLIATVVDVNLGGLELEESVKGSGVCSIDAEELRYLKLVGEIKTTTVQPKIIQLLEYDGDLIGLGDDGIVYYNDCAKWEVYSYASF